jgi:hypothetical protein
MTDDAIPDLQLQNLTVKGSTVLQALEAESRPVVPQGVSVTTQNYTIPPSLANNSTIIFQAPVFPNATCFLPLGSSVPFGFYVRVMNMDNGSAPVVVRASGQDKIVRNRPNQSTGTTITFFVVNATFSSNYRWLGNFWFNYF